MKKIILLGVLSLFLVVLCGCVKKYPSQEGGIQQNQTQEQPSIAEEKKCQTDGDCACGRHKTTKECFYGNRNFVDPLLRPCPDFCTGIDGRSRTKCVNGECRQVRVRASETAE